MPIENFGGFTDQEEPTSGKNLLDHYFAAVYNKLEADALLFNRKLPHAGLAGAENENALASLLRDFLPPRIGVEVSGIVIDRHGQESRQCDIILYDAATFPRYLRKVFPVEVVYGTIEVKTTLSSQQAQKARENLKSVAELDFRPRLTNFWLTRTREYRILPEPPLGFIFAFRSEIKAFETFAGWFPFEVVLDGMPLRKTEFGPEIRSLVVTCLDKGIIKISSTNLHIARWVAQATTDHSDRLLETTVDGRPMRIDPAKSLFFFLETLWQRLSSHYLHPGFDIRSYMSRQLISFIDVGAVDPMPPDWYLAPRGKTDIGEPEAEPQPTSAGEIHEEKVR